MTNLKKILMAIAGTAIVLIILYGAGQKATSHIIGITTEIPDDLQSFENFKEMEYRHLQRIRNPEYSFEDMKQDQMEELEYKVRYAEVIYKLLKKLDKVNQLGR